MRSGKVENGLQSQDDTGLGQKPQTQSTTLNVNAELHNTQVDMSHIASTLIAKMPNPRPATPPALINWRSVHSVASPATALSFFLFRHNTPPSLSTRLFACSTRVTQLVTCTSYTHNQAFKLLLFLWHTCPTQPRTPTPRVNRRAAFTRLPTHAQVKLGYSLEAAGKRRGFAYTSDCIWRPQRCH